MWNTITNKGNPSRLPAPATTKPSAADIDLLIPKLASSRFARQTVSKCTHSCPAIVPCRSPSSLFIRIRIYTTVLDKSATTQTTKFDIKSLLSPFRKICCPYIPEIASEWRWESCKAQILCQSGSVFVATSAIDATLQVTK